MTFVGVLGTVGSVAAWALLALLAVAGAAAAVPFDALYDSGRSPHPFQLSWLWGAVRLYPRPRKEGKTRRRDETEARKKKRKARSGDQPNRARLGATVKLLGEPEFRWTLLQDLKRLLRRVAIPRFDIRVIIGLADPADTGLAYGTLAAAAGVAGIDPERGTGGDNTRRLRIEPLFDEEALTIDGLARLRIVPITVVGTALLIAIGPTGRRVLGTLWRTRKR